MGAEFKPTRSELLELKKRIVLSRKGYKLLKMKRDGLIMEFMKNLDRAKDVRARIIRDYRDADERLSVAMALEGALAINSVTPSIKKTSDVEVRNRNVMGVVVPTVTSDRVERKMDERGYGIIGTGPSIDDAAKAYEQLVADVIMAAEIETTIKRLIEEIERTKRRVNALEFKVIPELTQKEAFIRLRLEELERENIFRLKHVKKKAAKQRSS
jgi:V/A-type H+/Na+-transporting ATPase subunit D